jgi:eukaryotic-like serine/threonine-protein kinase
MAIPPGTLIAGRYAVRRQLGAGAQGEVYEVTDTHEGDVVALKLLSALPPGGPWQEARILRRLSDPHILPIRNADVVVGQPFLVTELATHGTVESLLTAAGPKGLDADDVIRWLRHACNGVQRAHDLRLLHNDIKPGNLFLNAENECLVADFGFAAYLAPGVVSTPPPGATPETVAPEIAAAWGSLLPTASFCSDVYSLGATAYWLLSGRPAADFGGVTDVPTKMAIVAAQAPVRLRDLAPHVTHHVARTIERAMARSPTDRFSTPTELAAALGGRPSIMRRWSRTDEHPGHLGCWRGVPVASPSASTYVLCLEPGPTASRGTITTRHVRSGRLVGGGSRAIMVRSWGRAVRSVMQRIG